MQADDGSLGRLVGMYQVTTVDGTLYGSNADVIGRLMCDGCLPTDLRQPRSLLFT
jgi:hypothetical protein